MAAVGATIARPFAPHDLVVLLGSGVLGTEASAICSALMRSDLRPKWARRSTVMM
jgi:hypothetical protein